MEIVNKINKKNKINKIKIKIKNKIIRKLIN